MPQCARRLALASLTSPLEPHRSIVACPAKPHLSA